VRKVILVELLRLLLGLLVVDGVGTGCLSRNVSLVSSMLRYFLDPAVCGERQNLPPCPEGMLAVWCGVGDVKEGIVGKVGRRRELGSSVRAVRRGSSHAMQEKWDVFGCATGMWLMLRSRGF
jgi:hypothetical protein